MNSYSVYLAVEDSSLWHSPCDTTKISASQSGRNFDPFCYTAILHSRTNTHIHVMVYWRSDTDCSCKECHIFAIVVSWCLIFEIQTELVTTRAI